MTAMSVSSIYSSLRRKHGIIETRIVLMDNTCLKEKFDKCLTGVEILCRVGEKLALPEAELKHFGLKYPDTDGQMNWLTLSEPVKKQLGKEPFHFQLCVRVYPETSEQLSEQCLRLCCYQIKCDFNRGHLICDPIQHVAIDSYFAQAVIGDFAPKVHKPGYLEDFLGLFFMTPSGINCSTEVNAHEYETSVTQRHQGHRGMKTKEAWLSLLNMVSTVPHFNVLKHQAKDHCDKTKVQILISEQGVDVYKQNGLSEPDLLKRHYEWKNLASFTCYNNKLTMRGASCSSSGKSKCTFKFSGMYGEKAAKRALDDILECRLYCNCSASATNPLMFHTEESKRRVEKEFSRRRGSSKFSSFRNEPVMQRKSSIRRAYSSMRHRFSKKSEKNVGKDGGVDDDELGYRSRLSKIEMVPSA